MKIKNCLTIDLGATSGRAIVATFDGTKVSMREIARFDNPMIPLGGHLFWDLPALYNNIVSALRIVASEGLDISSMAIDTWGCDFAMFGADGQLLSLPYCYRDSHTEGAMERLFERMPKEEVYGRTGIQFMEFNSLFQLDTLRRNNCTALQSADKILFIPDALSYMLTGKMVTEYTIASTSQMLDPRTKRFDKELMEAVGVSEEQFGRFVFPGEEVGPLSEEVQRQTGLGAIPVIAVAGHDTGSAVAAVPAQNERFAYLSSGTWSLMGIEVKDAIITEESYKVNFTNEGGVEGTTRFLKNICGMWLLERCRKEWTTDYSYPELIEAAMAAPAFRSLINPDDACFANPDRMIDAIQDYCRRTGQPVPETHGELTRCIFESLPLRYKQVFGWMQGMAPFAIEKLHVIGGGSKNNVLNQFTANALGIPVVAGPSEATAIGNIMLQAKAVGMVGDIQEMRSLIASSIETVEFLPQDTEVWNEAFQKFVEVTK